MAGKIPLFRFSAIQMTHVNYFLKGKTTSVALVTFSDLEKSCVCWRINAFQV